MKKYCYIVSLMLLCCYVIIIQACKPQRGGVGIGKICGDDARLASGDFDSGAEVPISVYRGLSVGAHLTWKNQKTNSNDHSAINSCTSVISLEEEKGELIAYVGTAYHCVRNMAEQHLNREVDEYAFYLNVDADADCQRQGGKKTHFVRVPFEINSSEYLKSLVAKIQRIKNKNPSINIAQHDRFWLEKSLGYPNHEDEEKLEDLKANLKLSDDIIRDIADFNKRFDHEICTTSPVSAEGSRNASFDNFHHYIKQSNLSNNSQDHISNSCFLSNDVVFFKVKIDKFYLNSEFIYKCLKTSYLKTEKSENEIVPLSLNMGDHPNKQSEWSKSVVSFHQEALQSDSRVQQNTESENEKHHRDMFNRIMKKNFRIVEDTINHGTQHQTDDFKVKVHEIDDHSQDLYHLRLLTFYKKEDQDPYEFKNLKIAYSKKQLEADRHFTNFFGKIYSIFHRHWGISLVLVGLKVNPGSSGSLMISGNDVDGFEIMAAFYSKDGQEYSTAHGPIDPADFIGRMKPRRDIRQPRNDDNDETIPYLSTRSPETPSSQKPTVDEAEKRDSEQHRTGDLNSSTQPTDGDMAGGTEDRQPSASQESPEETEQEDTKQEKTEQEDKTDYTIRDSSGDAKVRGLDGC